MPGRGTIGIEIPNHKPCQVRLRDVVETTEFQKADMELPVAVGLLCGCDRCGLGAGNTSFALRGDGQPA